MSKVKTASVTTSHADQTPVEDGVVMEVSTRPAAQGLCITCRHEPRCLFVKAARLPIQHCEEFDDGGSAAKSGLTSAAPATPAVTFGQGQTVGICTNCDTRLTCMHREPGANVQECEDYS